MAEEDLWLENTVQERQILQNAAVMKFLVDNLCRMPDCPRVRCRCEIRASLEYFTSFNFARSVAERPTIPKISPERAKSFALNLFDTGHSRKASVAWSPASTRKVNARSRGSGATNKFFIRGLPLLCPPVRESEWGDKGGLRSERFCTVVSVN